jgi:exodeoxyribonuclease VII large subunit
LWAFNDETLVRFAREFPRPLISAVGHETDFTLLDFAADLRAPTPSAAAELCAPDIDEVRFALAAARARLHGALEGEVELSRARLKGLRARRVLAAPAERLDAPRERLQTLRARGREAARQRVKIERRRTEFARAKLHTLDPARVLARGYALVSTREGGRLVASVEEARDAKNLRVALHDGSFDADYQES